MKARVLAFVVPALLASPGFAADLAQSVPYYGGPAEVFSPTPARDWRGFYAGLQLGYFAGDATRSSDDLPTNGFDYDGVFGGAVAGVNFQSGPWVYGVEGDANYADVSASFPVLGDSFEVDTNFIFTARGRVGYAFNRVLVFATAGLAGAHVDLTDVGFGSDSGTMLGWTAGGGAEVALTENLSLRGDILYFDLGDHTFEAGSFDDVVDLDGWMARLALNYGL